MTTDAAHSPAAVVARGWGWRHASRLAWALRGVELRIDPGERVLLLGASGAGKSTLLQGLAGVLGGDEEGEAEGALLIDGAPAANARGRAGLLLQDPDSQVILARVGDDVAFGCENLGVPREEIWRRVRESLAAVSLDVPLDRSTAALSGGQKQRLALAGIMAMRPGLLLLDEPTANIDPAGVGQVQAAVRRALDASGATFVVVEHRVEVWLPIVDRVIVLGEGGVIADGPAERVFRERGSELAASGCWVPGIPPALPAPPAAAGDVLLRARDLAVGRGGDGVTRGGAGGRAGSARAGRGRGGTGRGGTLAGTGRGGTLAARRLRRLPAPEAVARGRDLEGRAGATLAITGPNGAGKSTLGMTLAGLLAPVGGEVEASPALAGMRGPHPFSWSSTDLLTRIGTVLQSPEHQLLARTVRGELEVGPRALGLGEAETARRVDELLERLRLEQLAAANPFTLSGGEKRRLTVAAALATAPRALVLDEPTFGQDARTWAELVAILARLRDEGSAIVAITHDEQVVRALRATRFTLGDAA